MIALNNGFNADSFQVGLAVSLALLGSATGAAVAGPVANLIARVRTLTLAADLS